MTPRLVNRFSSFVTLVYRLAFIVTFLFTAVTYIVPRLKDWLTAGAETKKEEPKVKKKPAVKKKPEKRATKSTPQRHCRRHRARVRNCNCK